MIKVHNTLTGTKEEFIPLDKAGRNVNMYVCGITPYDEVHLGHGRCYVVFDVVRRYLKYRGYNVKYIQNFTDIDDKIIKRSNELKIPHTELSRKFIDDYFTQMRKLNILDADSYPLVTGTVEDIKKFIQKIIDNGYAYIIDGDVYFSVRKFNGYGKLSKRNIEDLKSGARVGVDERKEDPLDFALWKKAKPGEPFWDSPWGKGRPGWHIECSAMSLNEFGFDTFDIHGGGLDLVFPHHENEIAQSEAALGKGFVNYWLHNGFVTINKEKMSKSLGNFFTLREIFEKYDPMTVRYFLVGQQYRSPLDFSDDKLEQAKNAWKRILNAVEKSSELIKILPSGELSENVKKQAETFAKNFTEAMDDDFNTPVALANIHFLVNNLFLFHKNPPAGLNKPDVQTFLSKLLEFCDILGLKIQNDTDIPAAVSLLSEKRHQARKEKNWQLADDLRKEIENLGYTIEDTGTGTKIKKK
ncbi:MAG: Cysteine--tRNA ligase [Elusimicrobia bacterium ADurb.Bin231]|nr:MAG: Cysteine--tRNA ligase [Elusimicrobia bacterium ADurb.Bin231]